MNHPWSRRNCNTIKFTSLFISSEGRVLVENYEYSIFDLTHKSKSPRNRSQMGLRLWHSQKPLELIEQLTRYTSTNASTSQMDRQWCHHWFTGWYRTRSWKKLKDAIPIAAFGYKIGSGKDLCRKTTVVEE